MLLICNVGFYLISHFICKKCKATYLRLVCMCEYMNLIDQYLGLFFVSVQKKPIYWTINHTCISMALNPLKNPLDVWYRCDTLIYRKCIPMVWHGCEGNWKNCRSIIHLSLTMSIFFLIIRLFRKFHPSVQDNKYEFSCVSYC